LPAGCPQEGGCDEGGLPGCCGSLAGCALVLVLLLTVGCTFSLLQDSKVKRKARAQTKQIIFLIKEGLNEAKNSVDLFRDE
jgi:hypothetical protein